MAWQQYVQAAQGLGFTKVAIIARANYQTVGTTNAQTDIAMAWVEGEKQINENQELLDEWKDKKKACFYFFKTKFNILIRDEEEGTFLVGQNGKQVICARQFNSIWFIASGLTKSKGGKKKAGEAEKGFPGAPGAYSAICGGVWDALEEAGV